MENHKDVEFVDVADVREFIVRCMVAVGTPKASADLVADVLVTADYRGHFSHGLNRLDMYVNDVVNGNYDVGAEPLIVKQTPGTAFVDGQNGIGMVVGTFCMDLAIKKAKENGIGWVTCTGSNHYGIAGYYSLMAVKQGLIVKLLKYLEPAVSSCILACSGMSFTNTSPQVVPTRAKERALGTNPISFGAPAKEGDYYMLDMATSTVAYGKVEVKHSTGNSVPSGWIVDSKGELTTNPEELTSRRGGLLPLGGVELTSGYKGYGLGMMVDTVCGVLSGGPSAQNVRAYRSAGTVANLGQTFVALDPNCFAAGFVDNMQMFMDEMRQLDPSDPANPVKVAGDLSRDRMVGVDRIGGIGYHRNYITFLNKLAERLKVEPIKTRDRKNISE